MSSFQTFYDPEKKILYGPDYNPLISHDASFGQLLLFMLRRESDKVLQVNVDDGQELTARDLTLMSIRVAQTLIKNGYQQEDVVGFVAGNTKYLSSIIFGVIYCGLQINSLDPSFDKNEIKHMFSITKPKVIFCDVDVYETVEEAMKEIHLKCDIFTMTENKINEVNTISEFLKPTNIEKDFVVPKLKHGSDQTLAIICSSGSTGFSKGVCLSHSTFIKNVMGYPMEPNQITSCFSTMYWISGLTCLLISAVFGSKRIITNQPFSPKFLLDFIEKYQITWLLTPPSQMALIVQSEEVKSSNLSSVKKYYCGGSAVPVTVAKKMQNYLSNGVVLIGYGMSEVGGVISVEIPQSTKKGSCGRIYSSLKVKIIDKNDNNLGCNEMGEICVNIGKRWFGYYGNEDATKKVYDSNGWLRSGDLGYFDEDGYLFLTGRKKEILKYKNFHLYPTEIESIILEIPDVVEACVCGIPDDIYTDLPAAAIIKKIGSKLTEVFVYDFVASKMIDFKKLRGGVYFLENFPKTASGKIQRFQVKDILVTKYKETFFSKKD